MGTPQGADKVTKYKKLGLKKVFLALIGVSA